MTTMTRILFSFVASIALLASSLPSMACPRPPGYGYIIHSTFNDHSKGMIGIVTDEVEQNLTGDWQSNGFGASGSQSSWQGVTDARGSLSRLGDATPATWRITRLTGHCSRADPIAIPPYYADIYFEPSSDLQYINCDRYAEPLSGSPGNLVGHSQQQNVTVSGEMYSTPLSWNSYDASGNLVGSGWLGQVTANSCVCYWSSNYFVYGQVTVTTFLLDSSGEGVGSFQSDYTYQ